MVPRYSSRVRRAGVRVIFADLGERGRRSCAVHDACEAELVKLRYPVRPTIDGAGEVLGIFASRENRDWVYARAWLYKTIEASWD